jgi:hypothetical protein
VDADEFEEFGAVCDNATLVWTNAVLDDMIHRLEELAALSESGPVDFSLYEDCADGTMNLWQDLRDKGVSLRYSVGLVIFHQLLYKTPLHAMRHF